jgi:hypothetical protein
MHFSLHGSTDEDVYSEEHFSAMGLLDSIWQYFGMEPKGR